MGGGRGKKNGGMVQCMGGEGRGGEVRGKKNIISAKKIFLNSL